MSAAAETRGRSAVAWPVAWVVGWPVGWVVAPDRPESPTIADQLGDSEGPPLPTSLRDVEIGT